MTVIPRITGIKDRSGSTYTTGEPVVLYCVFDYTIGGDVPSEVRWIRHAKNQIIDSSGSGVFNIGRFLRPNKKTKTSNHRENYQKRKNVLTKTETSKASLFQKTSI